MLEEVAEEESLSQAFLLRHCSTEDLSSVEELELRVNSALQSVDLLGEQLPMLRRLRLSESSILCVRELGTALRHLQVLWLSRCGLQELDGVMMMEELQELYIPFNDVVDLSPLKWLEHLEVLDAEGNAVSAKQDLEELTKCSRLTDLTIRGNPVCSQPGASRRELLAMLPWLEVLDDLPAYQEEVPEELVEGDFQALDAGAAEPDRFLEQYLQSDLDIYLELYLGSGE